MEPERTEQTPRDPMTVKEAAEYLRISSTHLVALIRGKFPGPVPRYATAGRRMLFRRAWLDAWLEESAEWNEQQRG